MSDGFSVDGVPSGDATEVLRVHGHLDAKTAPVFTEHCTKVCAAGKNLVLNLSDVSLIASSGIGALLALVEEYGQVPAVVRIAAASPAVEAVVKLLNLDSFLPMDPSEESAIAALKRAA